MTTRCLGYEHTCPRCKAKVHTETCNPPEGWKRISLFTLHEQRDTNGNVHPHREPWEEAFASAVFCAPCAGQSAELLGLELTARKAT